jgi:fatty acid desaturase
MSLALRPRAPRCDLSFEWPTLLLAAVIYSGWLGATWFHDRLPLWVLVPAGAWLVAWHGSLQHETIHGHPTGIRVLDGLIGGVPLSLWLPYGQYRRTHLAHHAARAVTDPIEDPEARYLPYVAGISGYALRLSGHLQSSLVGRLLLGPPLTIGRSLLSEIARTVRNPAEALRDWIPHLLGILIIAGWLAWCGMSMAEYLLAFVYPGTSLSLLRSFAEHRAHPDRARRNAVVERAGPFALLFLNNNLHAAHHRAPALAWYRLPAYHRRHRDLILAGNGGLLYRGYQDIARRYLFRAHDRLVHPDHQADNRSP